MDTNAKTFAVISGIIALVLVFMVAMAALNEGRSPTMMKQRVQEHRTYRAQAPANTGADTVRNTVRTPSINTVAQTVSVK